MRALSISFSLAVATALACAGGSGSGPATGTDASLASLSVSAGTLTPAFSADTTAYELLLSASTLTFRVTPTASDPGVHGLTVAQDGHAAMPIASGTVSQALTVPATGTSTVAIVVTAANGTTTRTYTLAVSSAGADASLSRLTATAGSLSPVFAPGTAAYKLFVPQGTGATKVVPTARDAGVHGITVAQDGGSAAPVGSGAASQDLTVPASGTSTVAVVVTAEDGVTTRRYTLTLSAVPLPDLCGTSAPISAADTTPGFPSEPIIPATCAVLEANIGINASNGLPSVDPTVTPADTARIQAALDACTSGSVKLQKNSTDGARVAFVSGPLTLKSNVTLWVDQGVTLFASQRPRDYDKTPGNATCAVSNTKSSGGCKALITAAGTTDAGVMGSGIIDGLGGEPMAGGSTSWWDFATVENEAGRSFSNPRLIDVAGSHGFTLYDLTLHNSPKFHVGLESDPFLVWGVTILTPSRTTNSLGNPLTADAATNTDGIDPSNAGNGHIVYSTISTGDDQIALKCGGFHMGNAADTGAACRNITIAHNHFGTGHGMSIGSETNGGKYDGTGLGLDGLHVYDLSIDGLVPSGAGNSNLNGIRIKSDPSRGGIVRNATYQDVCMRGLANPILLLPTYGGNTTGTAIPTFDGITIRNVRHVSCSGTATYLRTTLAGFDASHVSGVALDNAVVEGPPSPTVIAGNASITLGPGPVSFASSISGTNVTVTNAITASDPPNPCLGKFVAIH